MGVFSGRVGIFMHLFVQMIRIMNVPGSSTFVNDWTINISTLLCMFPCSL